MFLDPDTWQPLLVVLVILLIILSAFISLAETAFLNMTKSKIKHLQEEEVRGAGELSKLMEKDDEVYHTLVVSNTFVNVATASLGTYFLMTVLPFDTAGELVLSILIMVILIVIFGEIIPETIARRNPEKYSIQCIGMTKIFILVFRPFAVVFYGISRLILRLLGFKKIKEEPTITKEELKSLVDVSVEEGILMFEEKELIDNVTEFSLLRVDDVMTQRYDMVAVSEDVTYEELEKIVMEEKYSRIPVYRDTTDDITGILNIKDITFITPENFSVRDHMRSPFFTYEFKLVNDLFREMRKERTHMAIVLDEYGGTVGLVTIEDFLEEIVGEIDDEYDDEPDLQIKELSDGSYEVDGSTKIEELNEELKLSIESEDVDSVGGFVIDLLGRFPEEGEVCTYDNVTFTVTETEKNRVGKLNVKKDREEEDL